MIEPGFPLPEPTLEAWSALKPGTLLTIMKLAPDGSEAARYPGEVAVSFDNDAWLVVSATWTYRSIELDGLKFCGGDLLLEWFSPQHSFNAFAVLTREGRCKGWYANVTHPAHLELSTDPPSLVWHDLYVDLVGLQDKTFTIRDDDELEASRLCDLDPGLHEQVLQARSELIRRFDLELPPFTDPSRKVPLPAVREQNRSAQ